MFYSENYIACIIYISLERKNGAHFMKNMMVPYLPFIRGERLPLERTVRGSNPGPA